MFEPRVILASNSIRRKSLLGQIGVGADIYPVHINETPKADEAPLAYVRRMAREKMARARYELLEHPRDVEFSVANRIIVTADTIGILDGEILGKPKDKADAFAMWENMSDKCHEVVTSVCLSKGSVQEEGVKQFEATTKVYFIKLNEAQMQAYWDTGEPHDKAGGYAIQGAASAWVEKIDGSYANVVGLPVAQVLKVMADMSRVLI